ncbi:hypothetical protein QF038_001811 [Pseudarthrobacter sp. W1I19]|uniref:hypothetical protein n=1 Tax=Pseudarthrobacter sp. W1I19 TaxID=3042288 RepID=UPI0027873F2D|nr:hypothetical protein [Pseudarthrobacter sp. W1I19]MDQ0923303.1 hypothetical protein [Pseudarthrobacter sp. W1I19]
MIVKRTKSSANVPKELLLNDQIGLGAKGLYAYLMLMEDPEFVTIAGICIQLKENEKEVRTMLWQLEAFGYVADVR